LDNCRLEPLEAVATLREENGKGTAAGSSLRRRERREDEENKKVWGRSRLILKDVASLREEN
jgi:hypothetical protein